jgi:hypothetical protein
VHNVSSLNRIVFHNACSGCDVSGKYDRYFTYIVLITLREERRLRVFENRVLRRVFGPKRDEVTGEWRKLHNKELNDLYSLTNIVRVVKSRRMRRAGYVAHMGRREGCTGCWWGNQKERGHRGDPDVDGSIILRWIFRKLEGVVGIGCSLLRLGKGGGHL